MEVTETRSKTNHSGHRFISWGLRVWIFVAALAVAYPFAGPYLGFPDISIDAVYHGALFLGASVIVGVVLAFASFGLGSALRSRALMEEREHESKALIKELSHRFERFDQEFGDRSKG